MAELTDRHDAKEIAGQAAAAAERRPLPAIGGALRRR